jgi:hypothetical protein
LPIIWNKFYSNIESTISVYIGVHNVHEISASRNIFVRKVIKYQKNCNLIHDIAIIQLNELLTLQNKVGFACLPPTNDAQYPGDNIFSAVIGWGKIDGNQYGNTSSVLNNVGINIFPSQYDCGKRPFNMCNSFY